MCVFSDVFVNLPPHVVVLVQKEESSHKDSNQGAGKVLVPYKCHVFPDIWCTLDNIREHCNDEAKCHISCFSAVPCNSALQTC
jgi:hypothetical protein